jgi:hypothetical protein
MTFGVAREPFPEAGEGRRAASWLLHHPPVPEPGADSVRKALGRRKRVGKAKIG